MSECILTDWPRDRKGYGYNSLKGHGTKKFFHHRLIYADACGLDYDELKCETVRHTCDNPPCINPDHLIEGTINENVQDRVDRDRSAKGTSHGSNKLTEADVLWIRAHHTEYTQKALADIFGVKGPTIHKIVYRKKWTHI